MPNHNRLSSAAHEIMLQCMRVATAASEVVKCKRIPQERLITLNMHIELLIKTLSKTRNEIELTIERNNRNAPATPMKTFQASLFGG